MPIAIYMAYLIIQFIFGYLFQSNNDSKDEMGLDLILF